MDRQIVYIGQTPEDTDILLTNKNAYIGLAKACSAILGTSTLLNGFTCTQTTIPSMMVNVTAGEIYSLQNIDNNPYGSLLADTTHAIYKQGVMLNTITLSCPAPATVGFSINYLIQIGFSETDGGSTILPYYNSSNPAVPFSGPANNSQPNNTIRFNGVNVSAKAGTAAATGTQTTPSPDAGFTGAFVVTVAQSDTTILNAAISTYSNAPFITETLTQKISQATADARYLQIATIQSNQYIYAADTGTANTYLAALTPTLTSYTTGMVVYIKILNTNTGASTLNINSLGAKNIKLTNGSAINAGDLIAGQDAQFEYDGTNFQLLNPATWASTFQVQKETFNYAADTGAANAYVVTLSPVPASYTAGMRICMKVSASNTGASTINVNSLGTKNITYINGNTLVANELITGQIAFLEYDGTQFQLSNPAILNNSSTIPLARGGTNAALTASNGGIFYSTGSAGAILSGTATARQMLQSGSSTTPAWSTTTWPTTTTANQILYSSATSQIGEITTANNSILQTNGSGVPSFSTTLPSAVQLNITSTGTIGTGTWNASIIGLTYGGTGANLTASNGGIVYSTSSALAILSGTATAGQIIRSGANAAPSWSTATYPSTVAINTLLWGSASNVVSALATANTAVLVTDGSGNISWNTTGLPVTQGGTGLTTATTAYGVVCAGTTATGAFQVLSSLGSSGNVLTSNGPGALPSFQPSGSTSALVKISQSVASNSASIAFTGLNSTYIAYLLVFTNVVPATNNANLWVIVGTGGTPTYQTGAGAYRYSYTQDTDAGTSFNNASTSATQIVIDDNIGNTAARGTGGHIWIDNPSNTSTSQKITWKGFHVDGTGVTSSYNGGGQYNTTGTAVTAIKMQASTGNITSGTFEIYGILA